VVGFETVYALGPKRIGFLTLSCHLVNKTEEQLSKTLQSENTVRVTKIKLKECYTPTSETFLSVLLMTVITCTGFSLQEQNRAQ
jgi:hypothetical protein